MIIKLQDYVRIHSVISLVMANENANTERACLYYASFGAFILHQHFKLDAVAVSGAAAYHLGDPQNLLVFGDISDNHLVSHDKAFHAWVDVDGYVIDFAAPTFCRITGAAERWISYPARMFQKPHSALKDSPLDLTKPGDCFLMPNAALTRDHASFLTSKPIHGDLADICTRWFRKSPAQMAPMVGIMNQHGEMQDVPYQTARLSGVW